MTNSAKIALTVFIWLTTLIAFMAGLGIMAASGESMGIFIPITVFLFGGSIMLNGFIWQWGQQGQANESMDYQKSKRDEKLRGILDRLSEDERLSLLEQLQENEVSGISSDGELVYKELRR